MHHITDVEVKDPVVLVLDTQDCLNIVLQPDTFLR